MNNDVQNTAELICELTRLCVIKEEKFAASFNLSPTELKLLKLFNGVQMHKVGDLVKMLKLTPGRITHILTSLEEKKLVLRLPDESDKRNVNVKLQPKAILFIENLHNNYRDIHQDLLKSVGPDELQVIQNSLKTLINVISKWNEQQQ